MKGIHHEHIYKEYDRKYVADPVKFPFAVESSKLRDATEKEVESAKQEYEMTKKM